MTNSICIKANGNLLKKQNHLLQISVCDFLNDIILSSLGVSYGATYVEGGSYIGDASLRKYTPNHTKPTGNRNNIACGFGTFISAMLLQTDLNKL